MRVRMRLDNIVIIFLSAIMLISSGCASEPGMDKGKFSELNRTARELQNSITSGNPCDVPDTLLQKLVTGTAALKEKSASKEESRVIAAYLHLLSTYKDGVLLCQYRTQMN